MMHWISRCPSYYPVMWQLLACPHSRLPHSHWLPPPQHSHLAAPRYHGTSSPGMSHSHLYSCLAAMLQLPLLSHCLTQQPEHLAANAPASSRLSTATCFLSSWHYYLTHWPWHYCPLSGHLHPTVALVPLPMLVTPLFDWHLYSFLANHALLLAASSHPTPACSQL